MSDQYTGCCHRFGTTNGLRHNPDCTSPAETRRRERRIAESAAERAERTKRAAEVVFATIVNGYDLDKTIEEKAHAAFRAANIFDRVATEREAKSQPAAQSMYSVGDDDASQPLPPEAIEQDPSGPTGEIEGEHLMRRQDPSTAHVGQKDGERG